jgi:hypothetical protein
MKEELKTDPRLKNIDLRNPVAVFEALGGKIYGATEHFDLKAYMNFPQGKRLLTPAELEILKPGMERPIPDDDSPQFPEWSMLAIHEDNGGENPWDYNWDPQTKQLVYPDDSEIPDGMVHLVKTILGPKEQAQWHEIHKGMISALNEVL